MSEHERHENYENHPLLEEYSKLSVEANNKEFLLTDEFLTRIEDLADRLYSENEYVDYYWRLGNPQEEDHESGDPILCIETQGPIVPWERLSEMEMEMQDIDSPKKPDDVDNGNATAGQPKPEDGEEDTKAVMTPRDWMIYPDPEDEDFDTLPPKPERYPEEEPELVVPIPASERDEQWEVGEAIISAHTEVEWNIQARIDSAEVGATRVRPAESGGVTEVERDDSHDEWEALLRADDCEVIGEMKPKNKPDPNDESGESQRKPWDYEGAGKDETVDDGAVGDRWQL